MPLKLPVQYRVMTLEETRAEGDKKSHRFSVSSEAPVSKFFGTEILSHEKSAIDRSQMKDGMPVMAQDHITFGYHDGTHVGIFENDTIESRKLVGDVRFSQRDYAQDVEVDVVDKIRKRVSLGYRILKAKIKKGEAGQPDVVTATRWMPVEVTIAPVVADLSVGPARAEDPEQELYDVELEAEETAEMEERTMPKKPAVPVEGQEARTEPAAPAPTPAAPEAAAPAPAPAAPAVEVTPAPAPTPTRDRGAEGAEIARLAEANDMTARVPDWLERNLTPSQVAYEILDSRRTDGPAAPAAESLPGLPEEDRRRYSYQRALYMATTMAERHVEGGNSFDGLEGEVHTHLRKRSEAAGHVYQGGIMVPMRLRDRQERALDSATATAGAELVGTEEELIELLRNQARVLTMGARLLTGLTGPVPFPKQKGALTVYWVGENPGADVADSDIITGMITLTPKTMQGSTAYSRQLLAQSSIDVEAMVRFDLASGHALAIDLAALHGTGAAGQPMGIYVAADVQVKAMGGIPDFGKWVDMQGLLADANANLGTTGYITTPLMASLMMQTLVAAAAGADMIWTGQINDGFMAGQRAVSTNQVSKVLGAGAEHGAIYGNWNDQLIGMWNAMELIVDPFAKKKQALIEVTSFQMGDAIQRHGESFVKATGATIV